MRHLSGLLLSTILIGGSWSAGTEAALGGQRCTNGVSTGNKFCTGTPPAVSRTCSLSANPINFGVYNVFDTQALDSVGDITLTCSGLGPVKVSLGAGNSGTHQSRLLQSTSSRDSLHYQVYLDHARQVVFGDGASGTSTVNLSNPLTETIHMYARLAPLQLVRAGQYGDGLIVTFAF